MLNTAFNVLKLNLNDKQVKRGKQNAKGTNWLTSNWGQINER